jgi:uncharacterized protein (TIGR03066 family)
MRVLRFALLSVGCILAVATLAQAIDDKDKTNKEKIVGKWEPTEGNIPKGATIEFTKDGKVKIMVDKDGKPFMVEGTYEVDGDKLKVVLKFDGQEMKQTMTIKTLTDKELATEDEKGKVDKFKKK